MADIPPLHETVRDERALRRSLEPSETDERSHTGKRSEKKNDWVGSEVYPTWIAKHLDVKVDDVACAEIPASTKRGSETKIEIMYYVVNDYCYHHAVDIGTDAPSEPDLAKLIESEEEEGSSEENSETYCEPERPGEGYHMVSVRGMTRTVFVEEDEVGLSKKEKAAIKRQDRLNEREGKGRLSALTASLHVSNSRHRHRAPGVDVSDPYSPKFGLGRGFSHTVFEGNRIVISNTIRERRDPKVILIFGAMPEIVKNFLLFVKKWHYMRYEEAQTPYEGKYYLYVLHVSCDGSASWRNTGQKKSRPMSSIILPKGQLEAIVADFKEFQSDGTRKWYVDHGIPHRRSYLFYGPPGTGKTSTIRALAGQLRTAACFMSLSDAHFKNKTLHDAIMKIPRPSLLVLEDVDALFNEDRKSKTNSLVTFSGLLNVLDGMLSTSDICIVMTTNHPERLDPALTRAGRVDRRFEFRPPNKSQMQKFFLSFYPDADENLGKKFADLVFARPEKEARSMATLQGHFIHTRGSSATESVEKLDDFFESFYGHSKAEVRLTYTM